MTRIPVPIKSSDFCQFWMCSQHKDFFTYSSLGAPETSFKCANEWNSLNDSRKFNQDFCEKHIIHSKLQLTVSRCNWNFYSNKQNHNKLLSIIGQRMTLLQSVSNMQTLHFWFRIINLNRFDNPRDNKIFDFSDSD